MTAAAREPLDKALEQMRRDIDRTLRAFMAVAFGVGLAVGWSAEPMRRYVHWKVAASRPPTIEQEATHPRVCVALVAPHGRVCAEWIPAEE